MLFRSLWTAARAQMADGPNAAFANEIVTANLGDHSITGLLTYTPGQTRFRHVYALFAGSPGYGHLRSEGGVIKYGQSGNFLARARRHFVDPGTATLLVDAPSDKQGGFSLEFRSSPRYAADVKTLIDAVDRAHGAAQWTLVGTSEGSVSVAGLGRHLGPPVTGVVMSSTLFGRSANGVGVQLADVRQIKLPVLWVHHRDDACRATPFATAAGMAKDLGQPLIAVKGGSTARGDPCEAYAQHGYVGIERETIRAIVAWVETGATVAVEKN